MLVRNFNLFIISLDFIHSLIKFDFAVSRGFMTANGEPDNSRAARLVLKDFVNGKLLYCYAPPSVPQEEFHIFEKLPEKDECSIPARVLKQIKVHSI